MRARILFTACGEASLALIAGVGVGVGCEGGGSAVCAGTVYSICLLKKDSLEHHLAVSKDCADDWSDDKDEDSGRPGGYLLPRIGLYRGNWAFIMRSAQTRFEMGRICSIPATQFGTIGELLITPCHCPLKSANIRKSKGMSAVDLSETN